MATVIYRCTQVRLGKIKKTKHDLKKKIPDIFHQLQMPPVSYWGDMMSIRENIYKKSNNV